MSNILKVQLVVPESARKATSIVFRCPNCNAFISKNERDITVTCSNCGTTFNTENINKEE